MHSRCILVFCTSLGLAACARSRHSTGMKADGSAKALDGEATLDGPSDGGPRDVGPHDQAPFPDIIWPPPDAYIPDVAPMTPWACESDSVGPPMEVIETCTSEEPWLCSLVGGDDNACIAGPVGSPICGALLTCFLTSDCNAVFPPDGGTRYYCCDDAPMSEKYDLAVAFRCLCDCGADPLIRCQYSFECPPDEVCVPIPDGDWGYCSEF